MFIYIIINIRPSSPTFITAIESESLFKEEEVEFCLM